MVDRDRSGIEMTTGAIEVEKSKLTFNLRPFVLDKRPKSP
jgi:hypothetical protein